MEKSEIEAAIRDSGGNISKAARRLGVARRTLQSRMRYYGLPEGRRGRRKVTIKYRRKLKIAAYSSLAVAGLVGVAIAVSGKTV